MYVCRQKTVYVSSEGCIGNHSDVTFLYEDKMPFEVQHGHGNMLLLEIYFEFSGEVPLEV